MDRISQLQFDMDGSWAWLPWTAGLVLFLEIVRTVRSIRNPEQRIGRGLLFFSALLIVVYTVLTGRFYGQLACAALIVGHVGFWLWQSYRLPRRTHPGIGTAAMLGRMLAVLTAILLFLRPVWTWREVEFRRPVLAIAVDVSRSMDVIDIVQPVSSEPIRRSDAVQQTIVRSGPLLQRLRNTYDLQWLQFGRSAVGKPEELPEDAREYTALGDTIGDIAGRWSGLDERLGGVLLISDGRNTLSVRYSPEQAAEILVRRGVPLWLVGVGKTSHETDPPALTGNTLRFPRRVSAETRLPVDAEFTAVGLVGKAVTVDLYLEDRLVDSHTETIKTSPARLLSRFSCAAPRGGLYALRARAAVENLGLDATLIDTLTVEDERIRVLLLDRPRVEGGRIFSALSGSKELVVERHFVRAGSRKAFNELLQKQAVDWETFDVAVLGDINLSGITEEALDRLRKRVLRHGMGVLVLGGRLSMGDPLPPDSGLEPLLPAETREITETTTPVRLVPTRAGWSYGVCALAKDQESSARQWSLLAPLPGSYVFEGLKPATEILLATDRGKAVLIAHQVGKGHVAMCGAEQTWRWGLGSDNGNELYRRFWRQLILWLSNAQPEILVVTDQPTYDLGRLDAQQQAVEITAFVRSTASKATPSPVPKLTVRGPNGTETTVALVAEETRFVGTFRPHSVGNYEIHAEVPILGEEPVRRTARFVVEKHDAELTDPRSDLELLRRLAKTSQPVGGAYANLEQMDTLLAEIRQAGRPQRIERYASIPLVDRWKWWVLGIMLTTLAAEWGLRKRAGFV